MSTPNENRSRMFASEHKSLAEPSQHDAPVKQISRSSKKRKAADDILQPGPDVTDEPSRPPSMALQCQKNTEILAIAESDLKRSKASCSSLKKEIAKLNSAKARKLADLDHVLEEIENPSKSEWRLMRSEGFARDAIHRAIQSRENICRELDALMQSISGRSIREEDEEVDEDIASNGSKKGRQASLPPIDPPIERGPDNEQVGSKIKVEQ